MNIFIFDFNRAMLSKPINIVNEGFISDNGEQKTVCSNLQPKY